MGSQPSWVLPLEQVGRDDLSLAGGKGANLGELIRAGIRVPEGFVVTTAAYAVSSGGSTPAELERAITDAYRALGRSRSVPAPRPKTCPVPRSPDNRTPF